MTVDEAEPRPREIWRINHQRRGKLVVRLLGDPAGVEFFEVEVLDPKAVQLALSKKDKNQGYQELQSLTGEVVPKMRCSYIDYTKKLEVIVL